MWSHYSRNHTGFVIGLDTHSLTTDYDFDYIEPIIYQKEYSLISGMDNITAQFYQKFFHKSDMWKYEQEWRISKNHIKNRIIKLHTKTITKVIIGCCTDLQETKNIIRLSKNHLGNNIPIFKASKDENNFGLKLNQLE